MTKLTQETEDVVATRLRHRAKLHRAGEAMSGYRVPAGEFLVADVETLLADRQSLSDRIDVLARERDHWKAECKALCDVVSEHTKARAALHQEGIDG